MKKRGICILAGCIIFMFICAISIVNFKYSKIMRATQLSSDEWYEAEGYAVKFNRYEVLDMEQLNDYVTDPEQLEEYKKTLQIDGKVVLVYITLRITERKLMNKQWWTDFILYADNAWDNQIDSYLSAFIKDANPAKGNYEDGKEYDMIFPFNIAKVQIPEYEYDNADNWNYFMIWSQNPIVYTQIN